MHLLRRRVGVQLSDSRYDGPMPVPCPKCNRPVADGKPLCMYCGTAMMKMEPCPHCKVKNPPTLKSCQYCHKPMRPEPQLPAEPTPSALVPALRMLDFLEVFIPKNKITRSNGDAESNLFLERAIALGKRQEYATALALTLNVLGQFPGDPAALVTLGSLLLAYRDPAAAMRCAELALKLAPEDPQVIEFRANMASELARRK